MTKLLEADIKSLTLNELTRKKVITPNSLIINELTIGNFSRRVDLAVTSNNKIIAFEIKSEADSLCRLEGQVRDYEKYFDKVIVIADSKFKTKLMEKLPDRVGFWEITNKKIKVIRKGKLVNKVANENLLDMMDVSDLAKLATKLKIKSLRDRASLLEALLNVSNKEIRDGALGCLSRKFRYSTKQFLEATYSRLITNNDIEYLSRFAKHKRQQKDAFKRSENFWNNFECYVDKLNNFSSNYANKSNQSNPHRCQHPLHESHNGVEYEDAC